MTHPEHEALKLEFHHLTWALRHREITPEKAMERIADFVLAHTAKAVEEVEKRIRMENYKKIRAIHMSHDWNETSPDLRDWLKAELHKIQRTSTPTSKERIV